MTGDGASSKNAETSKTDALAKDAARSPDTPCSSEAPHLTSSTGSKTDANEPAASAYHAASLANVPHTVDQALIVFDADAKLRTFNAHFTKLYDFPAGMVREGVAAETLFRHKAEQGEYGPGDPRELAESRLQSIRTGAPYTIEQIRSSGDILEIKGGPLPDGGFYVTYRDITDYRHAQKIQIGRSAILEMIAMGRPRDEVMSELALLGEDLSPDALGAILLTGEDGRLEVGAAPSLPGTYTFFMEGLEFDGPLGPCTKSIERGEEVEIMDIDTDPAWRQYAQVLAPAGLKACWSYPMRNADGEMIGAYTMFFKNRRGPTASERRFIRSAVHLTSIAVEHKRTVRALRASEARFKAFAEAAADWFWETDAEHRFTYFSERYRRITDIDPDELLGTTRQQHATAEELASAPKKWDAHWADLKARRRFRDFQYRLSQSHGGARYIRVSGVPQFDEDGVFTGYRGATTDITDLRQTEKELARQRTLFEAAIRDVPNAVIIADMDMKITSVNPAASRAFGYSREELIGSSPGILYADQDEFRGQLAQRFNPEAAYGSEPLSATYRRKDGTTFEGEITGSTMRGNDDEAIGYVGIIRDVTARVQAERRRSDAMIALEQANRAKSQFLANISHDLRTPLNAVLGFSELMKLQYLGPLGNGKYVEYAEDIFNSGTYLLDLVNDILDISAIEAGKRVLIPEPIDLLALADDCIRAVAPAARRGGLRLETDRPSALPDLIADNRSVKQILINLLSNAIKFTPSGGAVTLSLRAQNDTITFAVTDTGKGIPAEDIPKLTDPFERGQAALYATADGTGLGLAITDSLVRLHGGTLTIDSVVNAGTTVTVSFPNGGS